MTLSARLPCMQALSMEALGFQRTPPHVQCISKEGRFPLKI